MSNRGKKLLTIGGGSIYYYTLHNNILVISSANVRVSMKNINKGTDTTTFTQNYTHLLDDNSIHDCNARHILAISGRSKP